MALAKSMDHIFSNLRTRGLLKVARNPESSKIPLFPNPPDRIYNYAAELGYESDGNHFETTLGNISVVNLFVAEKNIAVIGAGAAGSTLVRELVKLGFKNITLIEGTNRIGGRLYSIEPDNTNVNRQTVSEMGAMRMPLFTEGLAASQRNARNSMLEQRVH